MPLKLFTTLLLAFLLSSCDEPPPPVTVCVCKKIIVDDKPQTVCRASLITEPRRIKKLIEDPSEGDPIEPELCDTVVGFPPDDFNKMIEWCNK